MQELIVKTEKIVHGGQALARADRFVVFVDDALPGETVRARLYKKKKSFAFARAVEILEPAPERIPSDCALAGDCGGCTFRHCRYENQLAYKKQILFDALHGMPEAQALVQDVRPSPLTEDYRNRMDFTFGRTLEGELRTISLIPATSRQIVSYFCAPINIRACLCKTNGCVLQSIRGFWICSIDQMRSDM